MQSEQICFVRGDTHVITVSPNVPFVLGDTVILTIRETDSWSVVLVKSTTVFVDGKAEIMFFPIDTLNFEHVEAPGAAGPPAYKYDVKVVKATSDIHHVITESPFILYREVG